MKLNLHLLGRSNSSSGFDYTWMVVSIGVGRENTFAVPLFAFVFTFLLEWIFFSDVGFFIETSSNFNYSGLKFS